MCPHHATPGSTASCVVKARSSAPVHHSRSWFPMGEVDADGVWTYRVDAEATSSADDTRSLAGMTFAVKDNIDVAGIPTTLGAPSLAYLPERNATSVQRLFDAGAVFAGKTTLDQFATGLVGTRSPYFGIARNPIDPKYIAGGSSS